MEDERHNKLIQLPTELLAHIAHFLDLHDAANLTSTCGYSLKELKWHLQLWISLVDCRLKTIYFRDCSCYCNLFELSEMVKDDAKFFGLLQMLSSRQGLWPTAIDRKILEGHRKPDNIIIKYSDDDLSDLSVAFVGLLGDTFRSVVSNCCFPFRCGVDNVAVAPFARVSALEKGNTVDGVLSVVSLSYVAYYECQIHDYLNYDAVTTTQPYNYVSRRCLVSVGLACPPFPLKGHLPGSDNFSFGYRSEDGLFYHGSNVGRAFNAEPYAPGDIVGCGLVYGGEGSGGKGKIFFTKNGLQQGPLLDVENENFLCISWFPTVVRGLFFCFV